MKRNISSIIALGVISGLEAHLRKGDDIVIVSDEMEYYDREVEAKKLILEMQNDLECKTKLNFAEEFDQTPKPVYPTCPTQMRKNKHKNKR